MSRIKILSEVSYIKIGLKVLMACVVIFCCLALDIHAATTTVTYNYDDQDRLTGLSEGTTYYVRAYATNSIGAAYGNQISFTTLTDNELDSDNDGLPDILEYIMRTEWDDPDPCSPRILILVPYILILAHKNKNLMKGTWVGGGPALVIYSKISYSREVSHF